MKKLDSDSNSTFSYSLFNTKWWAFNSHVHTVVSSQFLPVAVIECKRIEIPTPDEDFLEIDIAKVEQPKGVVALFHGLEGSSERFYIRNLMTELVKHGFTCVAMNFRGCGSRMNIQPRLYHSGKTDDYATLFSWIEDQLPNLPLYSVGFSLGANAMIKFLTENPPTQLKKATAVSPPYDLKLGSINLQKGFNRVYEYRFIRTLRKKLAEKRVQFPELPTFDGNSLYDFDDQVTAPIHGFDNAHHYYETCSSKNFYGDISTPLLIIHSKEDTLTPLKYAPISVIESNPNIETIFTDQGGHVGFISSPRNWLNQTIVEWLMQQ